MTNDRSREILLKRWVDFDPRFDMPRSASRCPIAWAIKKSHAVSHVFVKSDTISFTRLDRRKRYVFETPPEAARFIYDVDHGNRARGFMLVLRREDLIGAFNIGPVIPQRVIDHDGRGAGTRGPRLRPITA